MFAALASGHEVGASIDQWLVRALCSLFDASQIAIREGVHAMTDVTGYGVAGHSKMLYESGITVQWAEHIRLPQLTNALRKGFSRQPIWITAHTPERSVVAHQILYSLIRRLAVL